MQTIQGRARNRAALARRTVDEHYRTPKETAGRQVPVAAHVASSCRVVAEPCFDAKNVNINAIMNNGYGDIKMSKPHSLASLVFIDWINRETRWEGG